METDRFSRAAMFVLAGLCLLAGVLPGLVIDALAPAAQAAVGARMPAQIGQAWLSIVPIAEARSSYNGLLVLAFIAASAGLCAIGDPPVRLAPGAPRAGLGLRRARSQSRDPVHGGELRPADPAGVRRPCCSARASASTCRRRASFGRRGLWSVIPDPIWEGLYAPIAGGVG